MRALVNRIRHVLANYPNYCPSCKCITQTDSAGRCIHCGSSK
jgi:hypothetical protein